MVPGLVWRGRNHVPREYVAPGVFPLRNLIPSYAVAPVHVPRKVHPLKVRDLSELAVPPDTLTPDVVPISQESKVAISCKTASVRVIPGIKQLVNLFKVLDEKCVSVLLNVHLKQSI